MQGGPAVSCTRTAAALAHLPGRSVLGNPRNSHTVHSPHKSPGRPVPGNPRNSPPLCSPLLCGGIVIAGYASPDRARVHCRQWPGPEVQGPIAEALRPSAYDAVHHWAGLAEARLRTPWRVAAWRRCYPGIDARSLRGIYRTCVARAMCAVCMLITIGYIAMMRETVAGTLHGLPKQLGKCNRGKCNWSLPQRLCYSRSRPGKGTW